MTPSFENETMRFVERVESLRVTLPLIIKFISDTTEEAQDNFTKFIELNDIKAETKDGQKTYLCPTDLLAEYERLERELRDAKLSGSLVPESLLVALVGQYDAFLGRLIHVIFHVKSELLSSSDRQMTFSDLSKFESIDDAKKLIVEKEIESVLRNSHLDQIKWLEKKLDMTLRTDLKIFPYFIEVTERRNLLVHADGVVSSQYISVCKSNGVKFDEDFEHCKRLSVSLSYFDNACNCIFEMGVKLAHVIWRKLQPTDLERADLNLNEIGHNLISLLNYDLALTLFNFATEILKNHPSEHLLTLMKINKAQALKWSGKEGECRSVINKIDWSAKALKFQLAKSVLEENYEEAAQIMRSIGKRGEVTKKDYRIRPIFQKFRLSEFFLSAYEEIYQEKFIGDTQCSTKIEIIAKEKDFECTGQDLEQIKFDISKIIESGVRKCCIGNDDFPPLEIHHEESESSFVKICTLFEPSLSHKLKDSLTITLTVDLLKVGEETLVKLSCSGVLSNKKHYKKDAPYTTSFYEGLIDEGVIWNKIDQAFLDILSKAKSQYSKEPQKTSSDELIWINH